MIILPTVFREGEEDNELMAASTSELDIVWREPTEAIEARSASGNRLVIGVNQLRVGPHGHRIYVNAGIEVGIVCFLVLERETRSPIEFIVVSSVRSWDSAS